MYCLPFRVHCNFFLIPMVVLQLMKIFRTAPHNNVKRHKCRQDVNTGFFCILKKFSRICCHKWSNDILLKGRQTTRNLALSWLVDFPELHEMGIHILCKKAGNKESCRLSHTIGMKDSMNVYFFMHDRNLHVARHEQLL